MSLKLYCNRYTHFKDPLVCSVSCAYRTRCQDFALHYDEHREDVDTLVANYFAKSRANALQQQQTPRSFAPVAVAVDMRALLRLEVKREMPEASYIWIGKDDQAELLELEEIIRRAERGSKAKHIYKVAQEMELRFQLVPRKRIEKAKRTVAAEVERAAARRKPNRPRPVAVETTLATPLAAVALSETENPAHSTLSRRTRTPRATRPTRTAKAAGDR